MKVFCRWRNICSVSLHWLDSASDWRTKATAKLQVSWMLHFSPALFVPLPGSSYFVLFIPVQGVTMNDNWNFCVWMYILCVCVCVSARERERERERESMHVHTRDRVEVCFDCVSVLCFVMGYMLHFGETAHKRLHYYYCCPKLGKGMGHSCTCVILLYIVINSYT